jgi:FtsZ-interacting cell division protein ZipA
LTLAHGGVYGLVIEAAGLIAITALLLWAMWRNRRAHESDEGGT